MGCVCLELQLGQEKQGIMMNRLGAGGSYGASCNWFVVFFLLHPDLVLKQNPE